jgi:hypothetical protein
MSNVIIAKHVVKYKMKVKIWLHDFWPILLIGDAPNLPMKIFHTYLLCDQYCLHNNGLEAWSLLVDLSQSYKTQLQPLLDVIIENAPLMIGLKQQAPPKS